MSRWASTLALLLLISACSLPPDPDALTQRFANDIAMKLSASLPELSSERPLALAVGRFRAHRRPTEEAEELRGRLEAKLGRRLPPGLQAISPDRLDEVLDSLAMQANELYPDPDKQLFGKLKGMDLLLVGDVFPDSSGIILDVRVFNVRTGVEQAAATQVFPNLGGTSTTEPPRSGQEQSSPLGKGSDPGSGPGGRGSASGGQPGVIDQSEISHKLSDAYRLIQAGDCEEAKVLIEEITPGLPRQVLQEAQRRVADCSPRTNTVYFSSPPDAALEMLGGKHALADGPAIKVSKGTHLFCLRLAGGKPPIYGKVVVHVVDATTETFPYGKQNQLFPADRIAEVLAGSPYEYTLESDTQDGSRIVMTFTLSLVQMR